MNTRFYIPVDSSSFSSVLDISGDNVHINEGSIKGLIRDSINSELGSNYVVGSDNISVEELLRNIREKLYSNSLDDLVEKIETTMINAGRTSYTIGHILRNVRNNISQDDFDFPGDPDSNITVSGLNISGNGGNLYNDLSDRIVNDELVEVSGVMIGISLETSLSANINVDLSSDSILKDMLDTSLGEIVGESSVTEMITETALPIGKTSYASEPGGMTILGDTLRIPVLVVSVEAGNGLVII